MSAAPQKRPWLQFHLSTAIIMMFVAAGLLWLNLCTYSAASTFGWPLESRFDQPDDLLSWKSLGFSWVPYAAFALDVTISLSILAAIACVCEWFIRRRERHQ